ncbi:MAG: DUF3990 domain-containing protein [Fimbriiglobus sp.]
MTAKIILLRYLAPPWQAPQSDFITLLHGTTAEGKNAIETRGIDLGACKVDADFGRGFYTTTNERQARLWAWDRFIRWQMDNPRGTGNQPVVLRFRVRRFSAAVVQSPSDKGIDSLNWLGFVRGEFANDDFWSLVQHCRQSVPADAKKRKKAVIRHHERLGTNWYDVVSGPVAAFWHQRVVMADADQFSFHTDVAVEILQDLIGRGKNRGPGKQGDPDFYRWDIVT